MSLIHCPFCGTQRSGAEAGGGSWVCGNCGKAIELPLAGAGIPAPPLPSEGSDERWSEGPPEDSANRWSAQAPLGDESSSSESLSQSSILPRGVAEEAVLVRRPRSPLAWTLVVLAVFLAALCGVVVLARSIRPWLEARKTAAQQATVEFWWPQLDSGSDDEFRAEAAAAIVALGPKAVCRTLEHISKESSDGHFLFVPGAVRALAAMGVDAVPGLCEGLRRPEAKVRAVAATILERMGAAGRGARDGLLTALDDPHRPVREAAIDALGYLGDDAGPAAQRLAELVAAGDVAQRKRAIQALGRIGPEARAAAGALEKVKAADPNGLVGAAAEQALKQIEVPRLAREARREASGKMQVRLEALAGDDAAAAIAAAQALGDLGFKGRSAAAGLALMLHHSDPKRRLAAAVALGRLGLAAAEFTPTLEAAARDEDAEVRAAAAKALEPANKP